VNRDAPIIAVLIAASDAEATCFWYSRKMADEKRAGIVLKLRNVASGRLEINAGHVRRGIQFLVNIGTPLVVGTLRGESQSALAAVVVGMAFGFADSDGPLLSRLRILVLDAACIGVGAGLGLILRNNDAVLWPLFVAITFAVGVAPLTGRALPLTGRHAAMAFTVGGAFPAAVGSVQIYYVLGVLLVAAVARTVDYMIAGPLPRQPAAPLQLPSGRGGWLRYALAFAGAATAALWIGQTLDPTHTIWVVATTLVVMQADARASYRRIVERIAGTFAGVFAAWLVVFAAPSVAFICAAILVVAPLIPHHLANRYWLHTALIAVMILLAYYLAVRDTQGITQLLSERVVDMLLGCTLALVGTAAAFPHLAAAELDSLVDEPSGSAVRPRRDGPASSHGEGSD
jgi:uncharacterized membrane protein YccC